LAYIGGVQYSFVPVPSNWSTVQLAEERQLVMWLQENYFVVDTDFVEQYALSYDIREQQLYGEVSEKQIIGDLKYVSGQGVIYSCYLEKERGNKKLFPDPELSLLIIADLKLRAKEYVSRYSYASEEMYLLNPFYYDLHVYEERKKMVEDLLRDRELGTIIAPGDGMGIVKDIYPEAFSSDLYPRSAGVCCLDIKAVLNQLDDYDSLLLIYVTYLLSEKDWEKIDKSGIDVYVIDNSYMIRSGFVPCSPYLSIRAKSHQIEEKIEYLLEETPSYTEELWKLGNPYMIAVPDVAFFYLAKMNPLLSFSSHSEIVTGWLWKQGYNVVPYIITRPLIIDRMKDLLQLESGYFVPVGRILSLKESIRTDSRVPYLFSRILYHTYDEILQENISKSSAMTITETHGNKRIKEKGKVRKKNKMYYVFPFPVSLSLWNERGMKKKLEVGQWLAHMILPIYISFDVTGDDIKKKIQFQSTTGRQKEFSFNRQKMVEFPQKWRVWLRVDLNESQLCAFEEEVFYHLQQLIR